MLTKETIKQAIDEIGAREAQIAYTLNEMLSGGRIRVPGQSDSDDLLSFYFGDNQIFINKYQLFNSGTAPLEQALLIQYGRMREQNSMGKSLSDSPGKQAIAVQMAGFRLMLNYEIQLSIESVQHRMQSVEKSHTGKNGTGQDERLVQVLDQLQSLKAQLSTPLEKKLLPLEDSSIFYRGVVAQDQRADFFLFPFTVISLVQAAELNLEFFHIRFLLQCLVSGDNHLLFACTVKDQLQGLIFLQISKKPFYSGLEIKYVATAKGANTLSAIPPVKGVGQFILASVWVLWKTWLPRVKEIFLDSEIQAQGFYEAMGFHSRGQYQYILKDPSIGLLNAVARIAAFSSSPHSSVVHYLVKKVPSQVKYLKKKKIPDKKRQELLTFVKLCFHPAGSELLARTALRAMEKNRNKIPESDRLIALAKAYGRSETEPGRAREFKPVAVVHDERYRRHLQGITHFENHKRMDAVDYVLKHPSLAGRWFSVPPRFASQEELCWAHTPEYVESIKQTAGKKLVTISGDTQATADSWDTARLAAGGVFSMLDEIMAGNTLRGIAFVRPPGHHATANQGMGFCLFNNVALGARYLQQRHGVKKILIIDIDAHHGNGTQDIFYDSNEILFISLHEAGSFPRSGRAEDMGRGQGKGFNINIPMEKASRARDIGRAVYFVAGPVAQMFAPEIILVSIGFDLYEHDRMTTMKVTAQGYGDITSLILEMAERSSNGRTAFVLEGGYSMIGIRECGRTTMAALCDLPVSSPERLDNIRKSDLSRLSSLRRVISIHKPHWKILE